MAGKILSQVAAFIFILSIGSSQAFTMQPSAVAFTTTAQAATGLRQRPAMRSSGRKYLPPPSLQQSRSSCLAPFCRDCPPPNLLFCSAVNDMSSEDSMSDSGSEVSFEATTKSAGLFGNLRQGGLKEKLLKISNWASLLCVLDCTLLPIATVILPLFGIVAASPAQMEWLHEFGHQVALYFVMPVGGLATTMNYTQHRKKWITAIGWLGLVAVLAANAGCHAVHDLPGPIGHFLHKGLHMLHHGIIHRVTNLAGCALLITSNYLSRKQGVACHDPGCTHDH